MLLLSSRLRGESQKLQFLQISSTLTFASSPKSAPALRNSPFLSLTAPSEKLLHIDPSSIRDFGKCRESSNAFPRHPAFCLVHSSFSPATAVTFFHEHTTVLSYTLFWIMLSSTFFDWFLGGDRPYLRASSQFSQLLRAVAEPV